MKTLYLLRHAKSDWSHPDLDDHDRPLAPRGRKAARRMSAFLSQARPRPTMVLCSSATRARASWQPVGQALGEPVEVHVEDGLYAAGADRLLARLRRLPEGADAVLLVGHNPGLQDQASELAGDGDPTGLRRLGEKFPTGALATLRLETSWRELGPGGGYLESLVVPRDLAR